MDLPCRRSVLRGGALGIAALLGPGALGVAAAQGQPEAPDGDLIGRTWLYPVAPRETLAGIALAQGFGYVELVAANPAVDPWLPPPGTDLVLPGARLLPDAERTGIVLNLPELTLYRYLPDGRVRRLPIGIGGEGWETPLGRTHVAAKRRDPTWWPPPSIRLQRPDLPIQVPPGPDNPMGSHALDLAWPLYRIHGTNQPLGVGRRVSHGCIRLYPADIAILYAEVPVGTPVQVVDQLVKAGWSRNLLFLEVHPGQAEADAVEAGHSLIGAPAADPMPAIAAALRRVPGQVPVDWVATARICRERRGIPVAIGYRPTTERE